MSVSPAHGAGQTGPSAHPAPSEERGVLATTERVAAEFGLLNLVVTHVGIDNHELGAPVDINVSFPLSEMSKHRQGELDALTSPRFKQALAARDIK